MKLIKIVALVFVFLFNMVVIKEENVEMNNEVIHVSKDQLDYTEQVKFENLTEKIDEKNYKMNFDSKFNVNSLNMYDMISDEIVEYVIINYDVTIDIETSTIEIVLSTVDEYGNEQKDNLKGFLQIDGSLILIDQDGESIFITKDELFEQCGWFKNLCNSVKNVANVISSVTKDVVEALVNSITDTMIAIGNRALSILFDTSAFLTDLGYKDKSIVDEHYAHNKKQSIEDKAWYGKFLNNQNKLEEFLIGKDGNLLKKGCGILAMYNVFAKKGIFKKENAVNDLADLIYFEEMYFGTAICGLAGLTPGGVTRGLIKYEVYPETYTNANFFLDRLSKSNVGTSAIVLALNDYTDITEGMHYYMVEKVGKNEYRMYNNTNNHSKSPSKSVNINQIIGDKEAIMMGYVC